MEYDEEDNSATGNIPEFGAIFMSSTLTKKECFKHNVFAMPATRAKFVKQVKAGMVLFLFEFEKRQLFGVFRASSDGVMDVVPHGFNYSGRRFPAQVSFTRIWSCHPVSESEFGHAISENYYAPKKFKFGLSEDQVHRLLSLFSSRKVQNKLPSNRLTEAAYDLTCGDDRRLVGNGRPVLSERAYREYDDIDYRGKSLKRATKNEFIVEDVVHPRTRGVFKNYNYNILSKRRRLDYDEGLSVNDETENEIYNHGTSGSLYIDSSMESLDDLRRLVDDSQLITFDRVYSENQVDERVSPLLIKYPLDPLEGNTSDYDQFMQMNRLSMQRDLENGLSGHYGKTLVKHRHDVDDDDFLIDDCVQREYNACDGNFNSLVQVRESREALQHLLNRKIETRHHVDNGRCPVSDSEQLQTLLHRRRKTIAGYPATGRLERDPNFGTSLAEFSSEKFARSFDLDCRRIHDRNFLNVEGRVTENMVDNIRHSASNMDSGCIASGGGEIDDDEQYRKSSRVGDVINEFVGPAMTKYSFFSKPKQNWSSSPNKSLQETGVSRLTETQDHNPSCPTFYDATITRAVPNIPALDMTAHGCSTSSGASWSSNLGQETHHYHGSLGNFYSLSENLSAPPLLEPQKYNRSEVSTPSHQNAMLHKTSSSFLNSDVSMNIAPSTTSPVNCRDSMFSKPSLLIAPSFGCENIEYGRRSFLYHSKTRENHIGHDGYPQMTSQHMNEQHFPRKHNDMSADRDSIRSEADDSTEGAHHPGGDLSSYDNQYLRYSSGMDLKDRQKVSEAPQSDSNITRKSVFTRLTSGRDVKIGEERNGAIVNCHDHYMAASADEVMNMLQEGINLPLKKSSKFKVVVRAEHGEDALERKQFHVSNDSNQLTNDEKTLTDTSLAIAKSTEEVPKETRVVDFKRRSETKKSLVGTITDAKADTDTDTYTIAASTEAQPSDSNITRKGVFRDLNSIQVVKVGEECNSANVNCHDHFISASADEVMEMLQDGINLPLRKSRKFKVVDGKALEKKQFQCCNDVCYSTAADEKNLKDARIAIAESTEEVPKETRVVCFKHHNETKKGLIGTITKDTNTIAVSTEAPLPVPTVNRKSVFTRLTSGQDMKVGDESNDAKFDYHGHYVTALTDEVEKKLQEGINLPLTKSRKSKVSGGEHGKDAMEKKQFQSSNDISHSIADEKKLNDAIAEGAELLLKETRDVDFKRRREIKKRLVGTITDTIEDTDTNREVESPTKKILKRKKLVRPVFGKIESGVEGLGSNLNLQLSGQIYKNDGKQNLEKAIIICKDEVPNQIVLASPGQQSLNGDVSDVSMINEQKELAVHMLPSKSLENEHRTLNASSQTDALELLTAQHKDSTSMLSKDVNSIVVNLNLNESSSEVLKLDGISGNHMEVGLQTGSSQPPTIETENSVSVLSKDVNSIVASMKLKETSSNGLKLDAVSENPRKWKKSRLVERTKIADTQSGNLQPSMTQHKNPSSVPSKDVLTIEISNMKENSAEEWKLDSVAEDPKEGKESQIVKKMKVVNLQLDTLQHSTGVVSNEVVSTVESSNHKENSSEGPKLDAVSENPTEGEKSRVMQKSKTSFESVSLQLFSTQHKNPASVLSNEVDSTVENWNPKEISSEDLKSDDTILVNPRAGQKVRKTGEVISVTECVTECYI